MKNEVEFFNQIIGLRSMIKFLKCPEIVYVPSMRSTLSTTLEGENTDVTLSFAFKGELKHTIDRQLNDNYERLLEPKIFRLLDSPESETLFSDGDDEQQNKMLTEMFKSIKELFSDWHRELELVLSMQEAEEKKEQVKKAKEAKETADSVSPKKEEKCSSTKPAQTETQTKQPPLSLIEKGDSASESAQSSQTEQQESSQK